MRLSRYFLPILRETPKEAEIVSHRLMLRAGMMRQEAAGIYAFLPLGLRVLQKICRIVREEQDRSGAIELLMPTIQSAELWRESGRYEAYGKEMLRITDRHEREMLYGPTNEEMITEIFRAYVKSYKDLPLNLYHIQWKFRDEVRPRFGLMRGREFLMKDAYSFDLDQAGATHSYNKMFVAYLRTFERLGLKSIPMRAESGPIGGNLSHEFIILAQTGESEVFCHKDYLDLAVPGEDVDFDNVAGLQQIVDKWTSRYAATSDMHDAEAFARITPDNQVSARGIEVEASHDDAGIIWPEPVAPFQVAILNLKQGAAETDAACEQMYRDLTAKGVEVLYDDRDERAGGKFATADLIGIPMQVLIGPKGLAEGKVEVKKRADGTREMMSPAAALNLMSR
jgi:prolyl-tRNA synthetase